ncbi:metallophosphoesterase family protein [Segnochrobactrum spirostomi]|uniref:Metallophosphoesterase n=1 Tax=Segnochrobactrum spirostomi TaxID=2608987 RepID=A0A6A7Y0D6_9HYPH|nr:metallophosphoesterase [Segnochrobactrum spirostomi]MQT11621.1 metallophosphoesterase [Segnochrobactrum spirostomi]
MSYPAAGPPGTTTLVHLSDLHFGRVDPVVVEALVAEVRAAAPDLVVVSGDLTMSARSAEFRAARAFLDALDRPILCVPGNHDLTPYLLHERFFDPYGRWRRWIDETVEPIWFDDAVAVVGLNSARRASLHWDWSRGRLRRRQLDRARRHFAALGEQRVRIVVAHHPFLPPEDAPETRLVGRAEAALALFSGLGVRLVLAGHLHRAYNSPVVSVSPAAPAPLYVVQASTATSTRVRGEPNAFNIIRIASGGIEVRRSLWTGRSWVVGEDAASRLVL